MKELRISGYKLEIWPYSLKNGCTLLELMVVVAIIVLLAGIILPNYAKRVDRAKMVKVEADISAIETAISMYSNDMGGYFGDLKNGVSLGTSTDPVSIGLVQGPGDSSQAKWNGPYLKGINKDPWGNNYRFFGRDPAATTQAQLETNLQNEYGTITNLPPLHYYIFSKGKNRKTGSGYNQDDINNWDVNKSWESYY